MKRMKMYLTLLLALVLCLSTKNSAVSVDRYGKRCYYKP